LRWHYNPRTSGHTPKGGRNGWKETTQEPQGIPPRAVVMAGKRNEDGGVPPVIFAKTSQ